MNCTDVLSNIPPSPHPYGEHVDAKPLERRPAENITLDAKGAIDRRRDIAHLLPDGNSYRSLFPASIVPQNDPLRNT